MNISADSYISGKLGVDNHLCHPLRSISWWALVVVDMLVLAMAWRNHSSQQFDVYSLTVINAGMLCLFFWLRTVVHQIAAGLTAEQTNKLRAISAASLSIAGCVAMASAVFAMRR